MMFHRLTCLSCCLFVLAQAMLLNAASRPEDTQTIFVPKQTVIFGGGGDGGTGKGGVNGLGFTSYCAEGGKNEPEAGRMVPVKGSVSFRMANGSRMGPMSVADAVQQKLIEITPPSLTDNDPDGGNDGFLDLRRGSKGEKIRRAIFEPCLFVENGVRAPEGDLVPEFFTTLQSLARSEHSENDEPQFRIWDSGPQLFYRKSNSGITTYTKLNHSIESPTITRFLRTSQGGTAILLQDSEKNLIAIDTAFGKAAGEALAKELCAEVERLGGGRLLIFATHPDADHLAGLKAHFDNAPCVPSQIIRPLTTRGELEEKFDIWNSMMQESVRRLYSREALAAGIMEMASKKDAPTSEYLSEWNELKTAGSSIIGRVASLHEGPGKRCSLRILRWKDAVTVNEHSLVTLFKHNEVTTMQLGDANERVIRSLLEAFPKTSAIGEHPLRSHVLVWPHHYWCPEDPEIQTLLAQFLAVVQPQIIVITQPKAGVQDQSKPRLKELLEQHQKKNPGVIIHWLEDGEVKLITRLDLLLHAPA